MTQLQDSNLQQNIDNVLSIVQMEKISSHNHGKHYHFNNFTRCQWNCYDDETPEKLEEEKQQADKLVMKLNEQSTSHIFSIDKNWPCQGVPITWRRDLHREMKIILRDITACAKTL